MGSNPSFERLLRAGAGAAEPPCDPRRFLVSPLVIHADHRRTVRRMDLTRVYQHEILDDMKSEDWGTLTIGRNWQIVRIIGPRR